MNLVSIAMLEIILAVDAQKMTVMMLTPRLCELCERGKVESVIRIDRQAGGREDGERVRKWKRSSVGR